MGENRQVATPVTSPFDVLESKQGALDLLGEAMQGRPDKYRRSVSFVDAKEQSLTRLQEAKPNNRPDNSGLSFELPAPKSDPAPAVPEPKPQDKPEEKSPEQQKVDDFQRWSLHLEETRKANELALKQEREERERALAQLRSQHSAPMQQPAPQEQKIDPRVLELYGFETPEQYKEYREHFDQAVDARVAAIQQPLYREFAMGKVNSALAEVEKEHEHFTKYFPREKMTAYVHQLAQQMTPEQMMNTNWKNEFVNAYRASDYDRVQAENKKLLEELKTLKASKSKEQEDSKAALKLVPKASNQGAPTSQAEGSRLSQRLANVNPRASMRDFGREMKSALGYHR